MEDLSSIIRNARIKEGFSQYKLAKSANLSHTTIRNIENGTIKTPNVVTLHKLANCLSLNYENLLQLTCYAIVPSKEDLATVITNARIKLELSERELANLADLTHSSIRYIENGSTKHPTGSTLKKLAKALSLDYETLLQLAHPSSQNSSAIQITIQNARIAAGLSVQELANLSGISLLTIYRLEKNITKIPALSTLIHLADVLNLDLITLKKLCGYE